MKTVAQTLARLNPRKSQDVRVIASLAALIAVALLILATAVSGQHPAGCAGSSRASRSR